MLKKVRFKNNIIPFVGGVQVCLDLSGGLSLHIAQTGSCLGQELSVLCNANYGYAMVANQDDLGSFPYFPNVSQMCIHVILLHPEGSKSSFVPWM